MRRIFRRHIRKTLAQDVPPILQEANFAFAKGEYGRAGELFERIAEAASARGGPRAPLFHLQAARANAEGSPGIFWEAHQCGLAYSQIERLVNLGSLPPHGFTVSCFPLRLVGGSAAPARVVADVPSRA